MLKPSRYRLVKALWMVEWIAHDDWQDRSGEFLYMCSLCNVVPSMITEIIESSNGTLTVHKPDPENVENHAPDCLYLELEKLPEKGATSYRDRRGRELDHAPTERDN